MRRVWGRQYQNWVRATDPVCQRQDQFSGETVFEKSQHPKPEHDLSFLESSKHQKPQSEQLHQNFKIKPASSSESTPKQTSWPKSNYWLGCPIAMGLRQLRPRYGSRQFLDGQFQSPTFLRTQQWSKVRQSPNYNSSERLEHLESNEFANIRVQRPLGTN